MPEQPVAIARADDSGGAVVSAGQAAQHGWTPMSWLAVRTSIRKLLRRLRPRREPPPYHALRSSDPREWLVVAVLEVWGGAWERITLDPGTRLHYLGRRYSDVYWNGRTQWTDHTFVLPDGRSVSVTESWCENPDGVMVQSDVDTFPPAGLVPVPIDREPG